MISEDEIAEHYARGNNLKVLIVDDVVEYASLIGQHDAHIPDVAMPALTPVARLPIQFVQHTTDSNRRKRRALVKAIGIRQFKKLYKGNA